MQSEMNHPVISENNRSDTTRERYEKIVLEYTSARLEEPDVQDAVSFVMRNLDVLQKKYPDKAEFLPRLCMFTDEVCKRICQEKEERLTSILKNVELHYQSSEKTDKKAEAIPAPVNMEPKKPEPKPQPAPVSCSIPQKAAEQPAPQKQEPPRPMPKTYAEQMQEEFKGYVRIRKRKKWVSALYIIGITICVAVMLWMVAGLLMSLDVLPEYDLGYQWFNENVLDIF